MLGLRLKEARKARGMTRRKLEELSGVRYSTIAEIENEPQKASSHSAALATALRVNHMWLATGKGPRDLDSGDEQWPDILAYKQPASLGAGAEPDEYAVTHKLKFRAESLARKRLKPDQLAVVYGRGDSMLPRIHDGDAILFDRSDREPRDGMLYVVTYDRQLFAKKLTLLGGRWFIESLNKDHPKWAKPEPIDEHKGFEIHGRVRWVGSWEG